MKKVVLLIMNEYKIPVAIALGIIFLILLLFITMEGKNSIEFTFAILVAYIVNLMVLWNQSFVLVPSITQESNSIDVFVRVLYFITIFLFTIFICFEQLS